MRHLFACCALTVLLVAGCGSRTDTGSGIPAGLEWRAYTLADRETGEAEAKWEDGSAVQDVPILDVTAQVENGTVILTDHASGETYTGTLGPDEDDPAESAACSLSFPGHPQGYAVYGVTEYQDGSRDATLYLVAEQQVLYLTSPLPAA